MSEYKLHETEFKFATIVWENEPLKSSELVKLCENQLDWKKSTTYTILRRLCERGILRNENAVVTSVIKMDEAKRNESQEFVSRVFNKSLPGFLNAFMGEKKLSKEDAEELRQ